MQTLANAELKIRCLSSSEMAGIKWTGIQPRKINTNGLEQEGLVKKKQVFSDKRVTEKGMT